jgi:hypothetical protein
VRDIVLHSGWEKLLVAAPLFGLLFASYFRLDELLTKRKKGPKLLRHGSGLDENGEPLLCDPDGQAWTESSRRK